MAARNQLLSLLCVFIVFCVSYEFVTSSADHEERQIYVVYLGAPPTTEVQSAAHYAGILQKQGVSEQSLVRSYTRSFGGFAAYITDKEQQALAAHDDVISVFPSRNLQLLTTQSWDFMGFPVNVSRNPTTESDIIIGLIDTGIWRKTDSFSDNGLSAPPKKWKGVCKGGKHFRCNNKIIGARVYMNDSVMDRVGHGSHTASIAAGNVVEKASFYGIAEGTARGAVPSARIAMYKVCTEFGCYEHDILSAFDDAIADGVDIVSISIGGIAPTEFSIDAVAIGAFHAMAKGILTVNAAGNYGIFPHTSSVAPWLFSVAATTTSRQIVNKLKLGNGNEQLGYAINSFNLNGKKFPLVYGNDASDSGCDIKKARACGCLTREKVKGKIVLCHNLTGIEAAAEAGASGAIVQMTEKLDVSEVVPIAASLLRPEDFKLVISYYNSTKNPEASIFTSQLYENKTSPLVASFSSRGPNSILPYIIKPDIAAPGVDILASFSPVVPPSGDASDKRKVPFSFMSGTSMACPHVAGAAAYVKSKHPDWSPSAIKSALMTTALPMNDSLPGNRDRTGNRIREFGFGAGFMNPVKAVNAGLVYETSKSDYVTMLCNLGYNNATLGKIFGDNTTCPEGKVSSTPRELNYPTMAANLEKLDTFSVKFPRTVTNVGQANSTYKATVSQIPQCNITVEPNVLSFKELNEKKSFVVSFSGKSSEKMISASLEWSDGINIVRSPIVVYTNLKK